MDKGYELYCLADPLFYDSPTLATVEDEPFAIARRELPDGWRGEHMDDWLMCLPGELRLPSQGWKIHAGACLDNAEQIVEPIWEYCVRERIPFKFIRSRQLLFLRNMKYAARGFSGKFVTIFPTDERQMERILEDLAPRLDGLESPYILSDLRWGEGPLYVRYGGFAERWCVGPDGQVEPAIENAAGELVPDRRGATFQLPDGVELPACLGPHLTARNSATMADLPYRPERALHFSNGGGVYAGVDTRTGEQVVLKEARPHAGLARDARDAVARLSRERDTLQRLEGLDVAPAVRDYFVAGGHHFLVMDYIAGRPLSQHLVERYPLISPDPSAAAIADFTVWALALCQRMEAAVAAVHGRGIVLGDLHPSNALLEDDGRIVLIDLEIASDVGDNVPQSLADPGFAAPRGCTGFAIDDYALACLRLFVFLPLTRLVTRDQAKAGRLAEEIARLFPDVPAAFLDDAVRVISDAHPRPAPTPSRQAPAPDPAGWEACRESMARAIVASATPERHDRLFPGDPKGLDTPGFNLAYGAAGVLYALDVTGAGRHPAFENGLAEHATNPRPGRASGSTTGCTAPPTCSTTCSGATTRAPSSRSARTSSTASSSGSAWTSTAAWPASGATSRTSRRRPASSGCGARRPGSPRRSPTGSATRTAPRRSAAASTAMPASCAAPAGRRSCSCASTSTSATRPCSTSRTLRWPRTCAAASCATTARWTSTRAGGRCPTWPTEAPASGSFSTTTSPTARTSASPPRRPRSAGRRSAPSTSSRGSSGGAPA